MLEVKEIIIKRSITDIAYMLANVSGSCKVCPIREGCKKEGFQECEDGWKAWLKGEIEDA